MAWEAVGLGMVLWFYKGWIGIHGLVTEANQEGSADVHSCLTHRLSIYKDSIREQRITD